MRPYAAWPADSTRLPHFETVDRAIIYRSYEIAVLSLSNSYPAREYIGSMSQAYLPTDDRHPNIRK
jgi:hypothetical protein